MFGKLDTKYGKKWHYIKASDTREWVTRWSVCGYPLIPSDKFKKTLKPGDELCQTCMLVRAHSKQKLNRNK